MAWQEIEDKIQTLGFTLFKDSKPDVGKTFEGVSMWQPRGFGGVILISVDAIRYSEFNYTDLTNKDQVLASSEWVGWKYKE